MLEIVIVDYCNIVWLGFIVFETDNGGEGMMWGSRFPLLEARAAGILFADGPGMTAA